MADSMGKDTASVGDQGSNEFPTIQPSLGSAYYAAFLDSALVWAYHRGGRVTLSDCQGLGRSLHISAAVIAERKTPKEPRRWIPSRPVQSVCNGFPDPPGNLNYLTTLASRDLAMVLEYVDTRPERDVTEQDRDNNHGGSLFLYMKAGTACMAHGMSSAAL
jgi:hypothetical protein